MANMLLEFFYAVIGVIMALAGIESIRDKSNPTRYGTGAFWIILAIVFTFGDLLPAVVSGIFVVMIGLLALFKQVRLGTIKAVDTDRASEFAKKLGGRIFIPSIVLAVVSILIASYTDLGGQVAIGIGAVVSLLSAMILTKAPFKIVYHDSQRMVRTLGTAGILPQLLATLGAVFTAAGVGELTSKMISHVIPAGNHLVGVIVYCCAMAIFTMIMGNAFAAFAVITAAIGVPFIIAQGGNPAVVAALGMTSGYCGTLMTPMAANFNSLPVALMKMDDNLGVIKQQAPVAIILLICHIVLMYVLAF